MKKLIAAERWLRWHETATHLGDAGAGLAHHLRDAENEQTTEKLRQCAAAARRIERLAIGETQQIARACATELEDAAS